MHRLVFESGHADCMHWTSSHLRRHGTNAVAAKRTIETATSRMLSRRAPLVLRNRNAMNSRSLVSCSKPVGSLHSRTPLINRRSHQNEFIIYRYKNTLSSSHHRHKIRRPTTPTPATAVAASEKIADASEATTSSSPSQLSSAVEGGEAMADSTIAGSGAGDIGGGGIDASAAAATSMEIMPPTARQLTMHALRSAVPMIGFGFMDNTIMIHAGHYVDCTLGVAFGLSTLAAAGIGQIFSGVGGVMFGDALDTAFRKISGSTKMTNAQRNIRAARAAKMAGGVLGVTLGCTLGLVNLLLVDEHKASLLKLRALEEGQEFEFEVEVDNEVHPGYTTVTVRGPDVDGVLASITASLASIGCSVVELHAAQRVRHDETTSTGDGTASSSGGREDSNEGSSQTITSLLDQLVQSQTSKMEDVFLIRDRSTHQAIENEDLDDLARTVLAAAKDPLNSHSLKAQVDELQVENIALADRVAVLEGILEDQQIRIVPSGSSTADCAEDGDGNDE